MAIGLIIDAGELALYFATVRSAEQCLEPVNVEHGIHTAAFGPNGEPYEVSTDGQRVVVTALDERPRPEALKALLLRHFVVMGEPADAADSLPSLLARCGPG